MTNETAEKIISELEHEAERFEQVAFRYINKAIDCDKDGFPVLAEYYEDIADKYYDKAYRFRIAIRSTLETREVK